MVANSRKSCEVVAYGTLKTIENFDPTTIEVVAVAYERFRL